jgi:HEPN domain-containing protein
MVAVEKHIAYWLNGAIEDWEAAKSLIALGKSRHGLFFLHLALEKALKARICQFSGDIAPRVHNLVRLAELSGLSFK